MAADERRGTIFLVDDNLSSLTIGAEMLKRRHKVVPLSSAGMMFDLLKSIVPDLILLDIEMPEMDGYEAISRLKANPEWADVPVVFLTGRWDTGSERKGLELGAAAYVVKPFSSTPLLKLIGEQMAAAERARSLKEGGGAAEPGAAADEARDRALAWQNSVADALAGLILSALDGLAGLEAPEAADVEFREWLVARTGGAGFLQIAKRLKGS